MNTGLNSEDWRYIISIFVSILPTIISIQNDKPRFTKNVMFIWVLLYLLFELSFPLYAFIIPVSFNNYIDLFRITCVINLLGYIITNWKYRLVIVKFFSELNQNTVSDISIRKINNNLEEKQIQDNLATFAKDATKLYSFSGRANFLNETHKKFDKNQFEIISSLGQNCKILVSKYNKAFDNLLENDVQIRLYPDNRIQDNLRGNIKICQLNGASACLFTKYMIQNKIKFESIEITNGEIVKVLQDDFNNMFKTQKNPNIKNIIFDLAGVAFDGDIVEFYKKVFEITQRRIQNKASNHGCIDQQLNLGKIGICDYVSTKIGRKLTRNESEKIIDAWANTWKLNPYIKQYINELKDLGYTVSIASNCDNENMNNYDLKGWFNIFDHHFLSNQIGIIKPDDKFFNELIERLKCTSNECLFIDDYKANIDAADRLGFKTLLIDRWNDPLKKIKNIRKKINEQ